MPLFRILVSGPCYIILLKPLMFCNCIRTTVRLVLPFNGVVLEPVQRFVLEPLQQLVLEPLQWLVLEPLQWLVLEPLQQLVLWNPFNG